MISIGIGDKVLMEFSSFGDRVLSVVAEIKDDGRMMVYSPVPQPILERLKTDKNVLVRYAHEGRLRGFKTQVLNDIVSATTVLELAKPDKSFDAEERKEPRCACSFPATVIDGDMSLDGVLEDISASCSRIRFLNGDGIPFVKGAKNEVGLRFFPFGNDPFVVQCMVKNGFMKAGAEYAVLQFKEEEREARARIAQFVEAQICCAIPRL